MTAGHGIISATRLPSDDGKMSKITPPTFQTAFRSLTRPVLELLFPFHCVGCGREGEVICESCVDGLRRLEEPFCDTCAQPNVRGQCGPCLEHPPAIDGIRAPYLFEGPLREAVHRLKWSFLPHEKPASSRSSTGLLQAGSIESPERREGTRTDNHAANVATITVPVPTR